MEDQLTLDLLEERKIFLAIEKDLLPLILTMPMPDWPIGVAGAIMVSSWSILSLYLECSSLSGDKNILKEGDKGGSKPVEHNSRGKRPEDHDDKDREKLHHFSHSFLLSCHGACSLRDSLLKEE